MFEDVLYADLPNWTQNVVDSLSQRHFPIIVFNGGLMSLIRDTLSLGEDSVFKRRKMSSSKDTGFKRKICLWKPGFQQRHSPNLSLTVHSHGKP